MEKLIEQFYQKEIIENSDIEHREILRKNISKIQKWFQNNSILISPFFKPNKSEITIQDYYVIKFAVKKFYEDLKDLQVNEIDFLKYIKIYIKSIMG
jgi:hypothetical protein